ncbi:AAA family ATPase [Saccharothrix carnea]|uniref:AAA family ATPase n=1 Tax=Saccharothrix carnea TaxID=1280637 RepID=UPI0015E67615|nr:AAA family ATPase [Saccharothrix carnea]
MLTEPGGEFLADHDVSLDESCWQYEAFSDPHGYLRVHAEPDRRSASEAEILARLGRWIGAEVFGDVGAALVARAPVTVRVLIPEQARVLAFRPFESAIATGRAFALSQVSLVVQVQTADRPARAKTAIGDRVRVLALFSLPTGASVLNLRRERHGLAALIQDIAHTRNLSIELRVVQYGVTRERLREVVEEADGWDVIHISAHGLDGSVLLEKEDGTPDPVNSRELVDLMVATAHRVRVVTLSACSSAAPVLAGDRRLLGIDVAELPSDGVAAQAMSAVAVDLAERLDAAVVGMRFPITDEFAIGLSAELYGLLLGRGQPVARALALALPRVVTDPATRSRPALSAGTPALFGSHAVDTTVVAPQGGPVLFDEHHERRMANVPDQAERFVGRTLLLTRAAQVLAPRSGRSGLLLHGMAGVGKTASVVELAQVHADRFRAVVWYRAPGEHDRITVALADFAERLEAALPGLALRHRLGDAREFQQFLPVLTQFCRTERVLFVLDNLESLLTADGVWRDARWGALVAALADHAGPSRVLLTSRRPIADLTPRVVAHPLSALSRDEAQLLARELPRLRALIDGTVPGLGVLDGRRLVARVLTATQGHPTLLELADHQAADPALLLALLADAERTWHRTSTRTEDFFKTGQTHAATAGYLEVLQEWTRGVIGSLPDDAVSLFTVLCLLEDGDQLHPVVEGVWDLLDDTAGRPWDSALSTLLTTALVTISLTAEGDVPIYRVHPAIAAVGRGLAEPGFRSRVDRAAADVWMAGMALASRHEHEDRLDWWVRSGWLARRAGRSAAPYLLRLGDGPTAAAMLARSLVRDRSPDSLRAALPVLRAVADLTDGTDVAGSVDALLATVLLDVDPAAGDRMTSDLLARPQPRSSSAVVAATYGLGQSYLKRGRLTDALAITEELLSREGRPWTRLSYLADRVLRRVELREDVDAAGEMRLLRERLDALSHSGRVSDDSYDSDDEAFFRWQVREHIYHVSSIVALRTGDWSGSLHFNDVVSESERRRDAPAGHQAVTQLTRCGPLLQLGRTAEARDLLLGCRDVFEELGDAVHLGKTYGTLAQIEDDRGHGDVAIDHARTALRYLYTAGHPADVAAGHDNLAQLLCGRKVQDFAGGYTHGLAGALLDILIGRAPRSGSLHLTALALRFVERVPATLDSALEEMDRVDGPRFGELLSLWSPQTVHRAFDQALETVLAAATAADPDLFRFLVAWEPATSALVSAAHGDEQAGAVVDEYLRNSRSMTATWQVLVDAFSRLRSGDRDPNLAQGDRFDVAITRRALAALGDHSLVAPMLWPLVSVGHSLGLLAGALRDGDRSTAKPLAAAIAGMATVRELGLSDVLRLIAEVGPDKVPINGDDPVAESLVATFRHYLAQVGPTPG